MLTVHLRQIEYVQLIIYNLAGKDMHVRSVCFLFFAEKGLLYMWGKNSHTILPDKPTSHKIFLPHGVNKNFRGGRIAKIFCGSWHAVAMIGRPREYFLVFFFLVPSYKMSHFLKK
jgi:hypothetical protein